MFVDTIINVIKQIGIYLLNAIKQSGIYSFNAIKQLGIYLINIKKIYWIFIAFFIVYIVLVRYLFIKNPFDLILKYNGIAIVSSIFGGFLILLLLLFYKKREEFFNKPINFTDDNVGLNTTDSAPTVLKFLLNFFSSIFIFTLAIGIIYLIYYLIKNIPVASGLIIYLLNILIFLGIFTLIYKIVSNYFFKSLNDINSPTFPKSLKFFINLLVYLPCLVNDLITYFREQYNITTKNEWILFISTILLFVLRYFLPKLTSNLIKHNGIYLSKTGDMYYLNEENQFGTFDELYKDLNAAPENNNIKSYNYKYALSFWFYLDAQPPSTNYSYNINSNIFSYGNKPKIEYNGKNNEITISVLSNNEIKEIYKTNDVPYQKWTNIIFNYDGGILDIFIDNKLVSSTPGVIYYMSYDTITTGKDNGIHGLIKNMTYFNNNLSKNEISWIYNYEKL